MNYLIAMMSRGSYSYQYQFLGWEDNDSQFFFFCYPVFCFTAEHLTVEFTIAQLKFVACEKLQT